MATIEDPEIRVRLRGGASIVQTKPLFSYDTKNIYVASGEIIKVVSVSSGQCVHTLKGHRGTVTALQLNPQNQFQLFSAALDGTVRRWEAADGQLLKTYNVTGNNPLVSLMVAPDFFYATMMVSGGRGDLIQFSLENVKSGTKVTYERVIPEVRPQANSVALGAQGSYVAAVVERELAVYSLKTKKTTVHVVDRRDQAFTCVACHPTQQSIVTGNKEGRIYIWHNIFNQQRATKEIRHWHCHPVLDLHFTTDGSYMLSGGEEKVLVKWQFSSAHKDTLPRLGSPLLHVTTSPDGTHYASAHADNSVQVISAQFNVVQHIQGLTRGHVEPGYLDPSAPTPRRIPLMTDPRTKALVLNGRPGHLQFYDIRADTQLFNLDIVCQNYVSSDSSAKRLVLTEVEHAAFSGPVGGSSGAAAGDWLATVERRDDKVTTPEMKLKFWLYEAKTQTFVLNTCVDLPHEGPITCLKFRPAQPQQPLMALTTSTDGKFKLWMLVDDTDIYRERECWCVESVGSYRGKPAMTAEFSHDGAMLAITFDKLLTLWDPDTNKLLKSFPLHETIRQVLFGTGECAHLLLVALETQLWAWNLRTWMLVWWQETSVTLMLPQPNSTNIALFTRQASSEKSRLEVIRPSDQTRIFQHSELGAAPVQSAIFLPAPRNSQPQCPQLEWLGDQQLFFLNKQQELLTLVDVKQEEEEDQSQIQAKLTQYIPTTAISRLFAEKRTKAAAVHAPVEEQQKIQHTQWIEEFGSCPASTMPPMESLSASFLYSLMAEPTSLSTKKKVRPAATNMDSDSDSDDNMAVDASSSSSDDEV